MTLNRVAAEYAGLVPSHCRLLTGPSYALLRNAFGELRHRSLVRRREAPSLKSVIISLGLTDIGGRTAAIARSLAGNENLERIAVVVGPAAPSFAEVIALQNPTSRVFVHVDPPDIAELMADADIAIGTPGTSSWERCCLGLPSILLVAAENQLDNARALEEAGAARVLPIDSDPAVAILEILDELGAAPDKVAQMSRHAAEVCDGDGAFRVGTAIDKMILPERAGQLMLRDVTAEDRRRLWLWRNEGGARAMSGDKQPVPWEAHTAWLSARLADTNSLIFIVEADGRPCGNVRFQAELTGTAVVSIAIAPHLRGLGFGAAALVSACREVFKRRFCERIEARVKRENVASRRIFLKAGFVPVGENAEYYIYHLLPLADTQGEGKITGQT
jgi:RimJ/RimL family protein N-acetyltransferase